VDTHGAARSNAHVDEQQFHDKHVGDHWAHCAHECGHPRRSAFQHLDIVCIGCLSHSGIGLNSHLICANFFNLGLGGKASGSQLQFTLGLDAGQFGLVLLVVAVLKQVHQLGEHGDQQTAECGK